jgi:hypothetical protein
LVITAPAMIAIMTILPRDANAGVTGLSGGVDKTRTAFSFSIFPAIRSGMRSSGIQSRTLRTKSVPHDKDYSSKYRYCNV